MQRRLRPFAFVLGLAAAFLAGCATSPTTPTAAPAATGPVKVKIVAINMPAGGVAHLAPAVAQLEAENPNHIFVAAGDLAGASPLLSALFHDDPTVEAMGIAGLEVSSVGNHEFDKGAAELLRIQNGGCHPANGCEGPHPFEGARYRYLAASTVDLKTGKTLLPAYEVKTFQGIPMAFIGLTLKQTPDMVVPSGVAGLRFEDEAQTVNRLVPELQARGVRAIVVLILQGGTQTGGYNVGDHDACQGIEGPIVDVVKRFDKAVDIVVSGHTHRPYNCRIDGRLVTSADRYGKVVTDIDVTLDPVTHDVIGDSARNLVVRVEEFPADPREVALIQQYVDREGPLARRVVGKIGAALERDYNRAGECALGEVIADSQLGAARDAGAQIAFMKMGGIRAALPMPADGRVRFEDIFTVQPFSNALVTMTLSGAQIVALLQRQWLGHESDHVMQVSRGFSYSFDDRRPPGQSVVPGSVKLDERPIDLAADYRVTVNAFMSDGGDSLSVLRQGRDRRVGVLDLEAFEQYLVQHPGLVPGPPDRITRLD